MSGAFFGKRGLVGCEGRRERGGRHAERSRECEVCGVLKPVQCFAKERPWECRLCAGELLHPEKVRRAWEEREQGIGKREEK